LPHISEIVGDKTNCARAIPLKFGGLRIFSNFVRGQHSEIGAVKSVKNRVKIGKKSAKKLSAGKNQPKIVFSQKRFFLYFSFSCSGSSNKRHREGKKNV